MCDTARYEAGELVSPLPLSLKACKQESKQLISRVSGAKLDPHPMAAWRTVPRLARQPSTVLQIDQLINQNNGQTPAKRITARLARAWHGIPGPESRLLYLPTYLED